MIQIQKSFEQLIRKWWFYLVLLTIYFLPAYTALPFDTRNTPELIGLVLSRPLIYIYPEIFPLFKIIPLLLLSGIFIYGNRIAIYFLVYVSLIVFTMAIFQNAALTNNYGLAILTGNTAIYIIVALVWLLEVFSRQTDFSQPTRSLWRYWVLPVALLAFWFPVNEITLEPEFSLTTLFSNGAGLTTCMILPLFLAILGIYHPRINRVTLRVSSYAALITALLNVLQWFILTDHWWVGVAHMPLLIISSYTLLLSFRD